MRKLTLVLPLALTLAACAPAVVRTGDARLTATARVPGGTFTFDCNPALDARRNGAALLLSDHASVSCPSTDGRATLALAFSTVTSPAPSRVVPTPVRPALTRPAPVEPAPGLPAPVQPTPGMPGRATLAPTAPPAPAPTPTTETQLQVLLVVPGVGGNAPLTYSGLTRQPSLSRWNLPWSRGLRGDFRADLGGGAGVEGHFNLVAE